VSLQRCAATFINRARTARRPSPNQPTNSTSASPGSDAVGRVGGVLELVGGFLLLIGLFTRPVAFLLSGEMAFAYFIAHAPRGAVPILNGGEFAVVRRSPHFVVQLADPA
jgi:uncharacterized membrane protein YphA (DoxX/SURF4 family)